MPSSPTCKLGLHQNGEIKKRQRILWVCEGPWDAMALDGVLRKLKTKAGTSYADTHSIVGLPGAGSGHKMLPTICMDREVRLVLDHDQAGQRATEKILKVLGNSSSRPKSVQVLRWPEDLPDGYDLRDLVRDNDTAKEAFECAEEMLEPIDLPPESEVSDFPFLSAADLATADLEMNYLIESILCADHPCGIIGPSKTMKTTLVIEMAISLATGGRFLNHFNCRKVPVAVMSGESGLPTIRETAMRISDAYGFDLTKLEGLWFCPVLPRFGNADHLRKLVTFIETHHPKVLIIDPANLCVDADGRESSLFAMGQQLASVGDLCREHGVTFVLVHHTTQGILPGKVLKLHNASWAGFEQYLRQWIGINRRKDYVPGTGKRHLVRLVVYVQCQYVRQNLRDQSGTDHQR